MAYPSDKIITYRSNSREVIGQALTSGTQVIGDAGRNKFRLEQIRKDSKLSEMDQNDEEKKIIEELESQNFFVKMQRASQPNEINFLDNEASTDDLPEKN